MLTFAYGSNLDWRQTRDRCPSARFVCVAKLKAHRLVFPRKSEGRGCGVAGVEPNQDSTVWGVVYQIDEADVGKLDKCEGYQPGRATNSYVREERHVYADGDETKPIAAWVYFPVAQPNPPLPNAAYKRLILDGAKFWHLPERYVEQLEQIEVGE